MKKRILLHPTLISIVAGWALILGAQPSGVVFAGPSPSMPAFQTTASDRETQIEKITEVLSGPKAQLHLRAMGLGSAELRSRLAKLDDAQLALLAKKASTVRAAGQLEILIVLLVIAIVVVIVISLAGKEIKVKDKKKGAL